MQNKQTTYKNTEIGPIPDDWDIVSFNDIADKNKKWSITGGPFGSNLKTTDYTDEGVQIIQLQNFNFIQLTIKKYNYGSNKWNT